MHEIRIGRPVSDTDIEGMLSVREESAVDSYANGETAKKQYIRGTYAAMNEKIACNIRSGSCSALYAKISETIVGMCVWSKKETDEVYVEYLYTEPKYQHQGVGTVLFTAALELIGMEQSIQLSTQSAQFFYERFGFRRTNHWVDDGITLEQIMKRSPRHSEL